MNNNYVYCTSLKKLSVKRFIAMLETDYKNGDITDYNLKCVDTVPLAKEGVLEKELDNIFGVK